MAAAYFCVFFALSRLVLLYSAEEEKTSNPSCATFLCGKLEKLGFPFTKIEHPECGIFNLSCTEPTLKIQLGGKKWYEVTTISQGGTIIIRDQEFQESLRNRHCDSFKNLILPSSTFFNFTITPHITLFKCNHSLNIHPPTEFTYKNCSDYIYYNHPDNKSLPNLPPQCSIVQLPLNMTNQTNFTDPFSLLARDISLEWYVSSDCYLCNLNGGKCLTNSENDFECANATVTGNKSGLKPALGNKSGLKLALAYGSIHFKGIEEKVRIYEMIRFQFSTFTFGGGAPFLQSFHSEGWLGAIKDIAEQYGIGCPVILIIVIVCSFFFWRLCKRKYASLDFLSRRNISFDPSKSDLARGHVYFGVPIFSYSELEEATNNFDPTKELGDGGFGTVYHGKLQDGREVAVKRLYENNYKRVEQFMNEVEILTRLHHKNLVSLYGCTSRHSRELLLVYEFIPNGTVADHLHGDRAMPCSLTWPIRMSIALETADALTYLHASDIIHRDVKTNNILLDNNFSVKVADFGLSRLFPIDATHVSTAPQGTPGYVDPEYHQCYRLTDKSDVYSFGVVLIELISSMPAIDTSRHSHEINLANLAIKKIQKCAFNELVDPCLGFESNIMVRQMITSVAELAFRCLQQDTEMRPPMDEVLEVLKRIESEKYEVGKTEEVDDDAEELKPPPSSESDDVGLLKDMRLPSSPISVTQKWVSTSTTPSASV